MKKIILLILVTFTAFSFNTTTDDSKLIGKWKGDDNLQIGYLVFEPDGYAYFEINGEIFGGKEFIMNDERGQMAYEVDETATPIIVDFIVTKLDSGEQNVLLGIAEFIDSDTMKFALGFDGPRPTSFDSDNSMLLTREK